MRGKSNKAHRVHSDNSRLAESNGHYESSHAHLSPLNNTDSYSEGQENVFDNVHLYGLDHGGYFSKESKKRFRAVVGNKLTNDQISHTFRHVNVSIADALGIKHYQNPKNGQISYRDTKGKFYSVKISEEEQRKIDKGEKDVSNDQR